MQRARELARLLPDEPGVIYDALVAGVSEREVLRYGPSLALAVLHTMHVAKPQPQGGPDGS